MLYRSATVSGSWGSDLRLALEVLHNVKESIIYIRLVMELDFDLVQVRQGVLWGNLLTSVLKSGNDTRIIPSSEYIRACQREIFGSMPSSSEDVRAKCALYHGPSPLSIWL